MLKQPCIDTQVAGLFHDSKEDHNLSSAILREWGVSERSIILIDLLTRGPQETRRQNICRIIEYPDIPLRYAAIRLKIDDIDDNLHIQRLGCVEVKDLSLINHYLEMRALLSSALL